MSFSRTRSADEGLLVDRLLELGEALLDLAGVGDQDAEHASRCERDELDVAHARAAEARVLHDGELLGELGDEAHGAGQQLVEVARLAEERLDRLALRLGERADVGELVDEDAVPLVGGDAARRGVRRRDELLLLEDRHVVADRRGGHAERMALDDRLRAHRLTGRDVVLHDGPEHRETAFGDHGPRFPHRLALVLTECQSYRDIP